MSSIWILTPKGKERVRAEQIETMSGNGNYTVFSLTDGRTLMRARTLKATCGELGNGFVRLSKSHVVNLTYLDTFSAKTTNAYVVMKSGTRFSISRRRLRAIEPLITQRLQPRGRYAGAGPSCP